jgi:hypothetical protein
VSDEQYRPEVPSQPLPDWVELSSPRPGRPLVTAVERLAAPVRETTARLSQTLRITLEEFNLCWAPRADGLGYRAPANDASAASRAAHCLVAQWLVSYARREIPAEATLRQAHDLWLGPVAAEFSLALPDAAGPFGVDAPAPELVDALLPYLLDPAEPATRRDVLRGKSLAGARHTRKSSGVYYTPGDVAHFMTSNVLASSSSASWLDPAAGSGVFLRAVLRMHPEADVYGIDLDPVAAESAAFVLTATTRRYGSGWQDWHRHRLNLATRDALLCQRVLGRDAEQGAARRQAVAALSRGWLGPPALRGESVGADAPWQLADGFPELHAGVDVVVQNPPYAPAQAAHVTALASRWGAHTASNIYPLFIELGLELLATGGNLAAVVPASIVTSSTSSMRRCRQALHRRGGAVEILSFDRAPDGLFGDDIKTRCSIVFAESRERPTLAVGGLNRITSRDRQSALVRGVAPEVSPDGLLAPLPPKLRSSHDAAFLRALSTATFTADMLVTRTKTQPLGAVRDDQCVLLGPTAYNWLNVQREPGTACALGHDSQNPFIVLSCTDAATSDAVYALLSSRVALWLWQVYGDGFHVGRNLLRVLPAPPPMDSEAVAALGKLGAELWEQVTAAPVVSLNGGRRTVAFPPASASPLIDEIDLHVLDLVGLSDPPLILSAWQQDLISAGRKPLP